MNGKNVKVGSTIKTKYGNWYTVIRIEGKNIIVTNDGKAEYVITKSEVKSVVNS